jgi:hypothetical protein
MKFRKKPVVIEAMQLTLDSAQRVRDFCGGILFDQSPMPPCIAIRTLEGVMRADLGDWVIRGVKGEFYPCKPDVFAATYEPADVAPDCAGAVGRGDAKRIRQLENRLAEEIKWGHRNCTHDDCKSSGSDCPANPTAPGKEGE